MSEHWSLWIAVGAGLLFLGWGGYLSVQVAEYAENRAADYPLQHVCLLTAGVGVVILLAVIARLVVIGQHKRHLNNLTAEGNAILDRIQSVQVGDAKTLAKAAVDFGNWTTLAQSWLHDKFPQYEAHFRNEGSQKYIEEIKQTARGHETDVVGATGTHYLEVMAACRMNRLGEITMKL